MDFWHFKTHKSHGQFNSYFFCAAEELDRGQTKGFEYLKKYTNISTFAAEMNKILFPAILVDAPASGTRTCLQDPTLQLQASDRRGSQLAQYGHENY